MFDDRDENCECVFCNCVFPSAEAIEIMNNPEGYTFPNEKYEPSTDTKRHTTTRVFSDENIQKTIKREELAAANGETAVKKSEFEVSPSDVKAPAKTLSLVIGISALALILILVISIPLYNKRKDVKLKIEDNIESVYAGIYDDSLGYTIWGQTSQHVKFLTSDKVDEEGALQLFENYCAVREDAGGGSKTKNVKVVIYCDGCIWTVTDSGAEAETEPTELKVADDKDN